MYWDCILPVFFAQVWKSFLLYFFTISSSYCVNVIYQSFCRNPKAFDFDFQVFRQFVGLHIFVLAYMSSKHRPYDDINIISVDNVVAQHNLWPPHLLIFFVTEIIELLFFIIVAILLFLFCCSPIGL